MTTPHPSPTEAAQPMVLWIEPWPDPMIDRMGHDPRSDYVETFWLGILGPSTTLLMRLLTAELDRAPDEGTALDLATAARCLGVGHRGGRHSPLMRSIDRLTQFGLAQRSGTSVKIRRHVPPLTLGQLKRLPDKLRTTHENWPVPATADRAATLSPPTS